MGAGMTGSGGAETSGIVGSGAGRVPWKAAVAMPRRVVPARSVAASGLKLLDAGAGGVAAAGARALGGMATGASGSRSLSFRPRRPLALLVLPVATAAGAGALITAAGGSARTGAGEAGAGAGAGRSTGGATGAAVTSAADAAAATG